MKAYHLYVHLLKAKPLITRAVTTFVIIGAFEVIGEYYANSSNYKNLIKSKINWKKCFINASTNALMTPYFSFVYGKIFPKLFPKNSVYSFPLSVIFDLTVVSFFTNGIFMKLTSALNSNGICTLSDIKANVPKRVMNSIRTGFDPVVSFIRLGFIPSLFHSLFMNFVVAGKGLQMTLKTTNSF